MVFGSAQPSAPASETQSAETAERELAAFGTALKGEPLSSKSLKPFRQVRFSLHTHLRFCLALMAATAIASGDCCLRQGFWYVTAMPHNLSWSIRQPWFTVTPHRKRRA